MLRSLTVSSVLLCVSVGLVGADDRSPEGIPRPIELTPKANITAACQPQVALVGARTIYVTFAAGDLVFFTKSTNGGDSFFQPKTISNLPWLMAGMRRGPRIVADEKTIVVSAIGGSDGNLVAWKSTDQGKSWQGPQTVNSVPKSAREGLHGMAMGPDGRKIACVWLDLRSKSTELSCSISDDGGASWGENRVVYRSPDGSICECCHPSVAWDAKGALFVMWRNSLSGHRDLYLCTSKDGGTTFSEAGKLGIGTWKLDACPMDGGAITLVESGKPATVWRRQKELFYTSHGDNQEQPLGPGEQPTIAAAGNKIYLAWVGRRQGPLMIKLPNAPGPLELATGASDPVLAVSNDKATAALVWETGRGRNTSIWFAKLGDPQR